MSFPVFLDTCAIYGATLADTLLRIAEQGAFSPHWSADVLEELGRHLVEHAGLDQKAATRRIAHMQAAFPNAEVTGYAHLIPSMICHEQDRHIVAAAARGRCEIVVTFNLSDFPPAALQPLHLAAVHPDDFLHDQIDLYPGRVERALAAQLSAYSRPRTSLAALLGSLARAGVPTFADEVRRHEFDLH